MTIPKLKICEPVATTDDINDLCVMIEKLERRAEEKERVKHGIRNFCNDC